MVNRNTVRAAALAAAVLAPAAAFADDTTASNEVNFGLMGVVGKNPAQAGRYDGLNTSGADLVGGFYLIGRPAEESGNTWYYNASGDNLVFQTGTDLGNGINSQGVSGTAFNSSISNYLFNSGSANFDFGRQGTWTGGAYYDAITYTGNAIDSIYTLHGNTGSLNGSLVPWGGATATTAGATTSFTAPGIVATGAFQPVQTGTRRDIFGGNFKYITGDWTFSTALRHEHKSGSMEESLVEGGVGGGIAFALPIDYTTDRFDATAAYVTRQRQVTVQYTFSHFNDANNFINLPYPISNTAANCQGGAASRPCQMSAAYSTPPSTDAHYLTLMAATNEVQNTRINLNFRVGLEMQDNAFAPDTADPNLTANNPALIGNLNGALQGTSANSLNAMARVFQGRLSVNSHPFVNWDGNAYYGVDGRNVSLNQYKVFLGNLGNENDYGFTASNFVVPQNWLKQNAGVDIGYRILPQYNTKVTAGYRLDVVDRSNAQVGNSITHTETVAVSSRLGPQVDGRLSYVHANRSGVLSYVTPWGNLTNGNPGPASADYSGAYYQAPMWSDAVRLMVNYTPNETWSGSGFIQFKNENFSYPGTGLPDTATSPLTGIGTGIKRDYNLTVGPDVNYRPREDLNLHFFYSYERIYYNNLGNGACSTSTAGACAGSVGYFQNEYTAAVHTAGISGDWKATEKLKLGAEYSVSYGSQMFGEFNGVPVPVAGDSYTGVSNYPNINSLMNTIKLNGVYELKPGMELLGLATWTYYQDNNWNDTAPTAVSNTGGTALSFLTPGYGAPHYSVVTMMTGMRFRW